MQGLNETSDFKVIPKAADWLNVAGLAWTVLLLITFYVLPVQKTSRHYLTVGLVAAVCLLQVWCSASLMHVLPTDQCSWDSSFLLA